jgi:hypothetical protein
MGELAFIWLLYALQRRTTPYLTSVRCDDTGRLGSLVVSPVPMRREAVATAKATAALPQHCSSHYVANVP